MPILTTHKIITKSLVSLLALLISACAIPGKDTFESNPRLTPYVEAFFVAHLRYTGREASINGLRVLIADLSYMPKTIARCTYEDYKGPTVYFDKAYLDLWESHGLYDDIEETIFHELGHCILGRKHNNRILPSGSPASMMHRFHLGSTYTGNREHYIKELFNVQ